MFKPLSFALLTLCFTAPNIANAAEAKLQGTYTDWQVYTRDSGGDVICYAMTKPVVKAPSSVRHGDVYFMVANWRSGAAKEQPSFLAGYTLKPNRATKARVGRSSFDMYSFENEAFVEDSGDEKGLVRKMRAGSIMKINAVSHRGTNVSYEFSLRGITAALKKAKTVCQ